MKITRRHGNLLTVSLKTVETVKNQHFVENIFNIKENV
jgi:hypothetical protein